MILLSIIIFLKSYSLEINLCSLKGYNAGCEMIGEGIYEALTNNYKLNFIHNRNDIPVKSKNCRITIYADMLWYVGMDLYKKCPDTYIKIAYTMFEGSILPKKWVSILNNYFDAAIVPNDYLQKLYIENGVIIPIFIIPMAMPDLEKINNNNNNNNIFTFGIISGIDERKGIEEAIKGFALKFGNNPNYKLLIHSYWASNGEKLTAISNLIKKINCSNIEFNYGQLDRQEILNLYNKIDCLIACSGGEGFSLTPREALKCEIPVICLDYGSQKNICDSGYVYILSPNKKIPCFIESYGGYCGEIELADAKNIYLAMQEIIKNYMFYKLLAKNAKKWLEQFTVTAATKNFKKLLSPQKIYLHDKNFLVNDGFVTNCPVFAKKFLKVISNLEIINLNKN
jgi:glycosyltransferase involved in cell wall biosynthesis